MSDPFFSPRPEPAEGPVGDVDQRTEPDATDTPGTDGAGAPSRSWELTTPVDAPAEPVAPEPVAPEPSAMHLPTARDDEPPAFGGWDSPDTPTGAVTTFGGTAAPPTASFDAKSLSWAPAAGPESPAESVFLSLPAAPRLRRNRAYVTLLSVIATALFAGLYLAACAGYLYLAGRAESIERFAGSIVYLGPVVAFAVGFLALGLGLARARYGTWAVFGLLLGGLVYLATVASEVWSVAAWTLDAARFAEFMRQRWVDPFALVAGLLARELMVWLGGLVVRHRRILDQRNEAALADYEEKLAALAVAA